MSADDASDLYSLAAEEIRVTARVSTSEVLEASEGSGCGRHPNRKCPSPASMPVAWKGRSPFPHREVKYRKEGKANSNE